MALTALPPPASTTALPPLGTEAVTASSTSTRASAGFSEAVQRGRRAAPTGGAAWRKATAFLCLLVSSANNADGAALGPLMKGLHAHAHIDRFTAGTISKYPGSCEITTRVFDAFASFDRTQGAGNPELDLYALPMLNGQFALVQNTFEHFRDSPDAAEHLSVPSSQLLCPLDAGPARERLAAHLARHKDMRFTVHEKAGSLAAVQGPMDSPRKLVLESSNFVADYIRSHDIAASDALILEASAWAGFTSNARGRAQFLEDLGSFGVQVAAIDDVVLFLQRSAVSDEQFALHGAQVLNEARAVARGGPPDRPSALLADLLPTGIRHVILVALPRTQNCAAAARSIGAASVAGEVRVLMFIVSNTSDPEADNAAMADPSTRNHQRIRVTDTFCTDEGPGARTMLGRAAIHGNVTTLRLLCRSAAGDRSLQESVRDPRGITVTVAPAEDVAKLVDMGPASETAIVLSDQEGHEFYRGDREAMARLFRQFGWLAGSLPLQGEGAAEDASMTVLLHMTPARADVFRHHDLPVGEVSAQAPDVVATMAQIAMHGAARGFNPQAAHADDSRAPEGRLVAAVSVVAASLGLGVLVKYIQNRHEASARTQRAAEEKTQHTKAAKAQGEKDRDAAAQRDRELERIQIERRAKLANRRSVKEAAEIDCEWQAQLAEQKTRHVRSAARAASDDPAFPDEEDEEDEKHNEANAGIAASSARIVPTVGVDSGADPTDAHGSAMRAEHQRNQQRKAAERRRALTAPSSEAPEQPGQIMRNRRPYRTDKPPNWIEWTASKWIDFDSPESLLTIMSGLQGVRYTPGKGSHFHLHHPGVKRLTVALSVFRRRPEWVIEDVNCFLGWRASRIEEAAGPVRSASSRESAATLSARGPNRSRPAFPSS
ncbi:hypothetical protein [Ramlibacter sp.]|uniref:hypothetical protein n=1 Tax=Ramlibacter sp. TaxID=1917967 RepID=UPI003D0C26C6